jgi:hypothetical protein
MYAQSGKFQEGTTIIFVYFYLLQGQATTFLGFILPFWGFDHAFKSDHCVGVKMPLICYGEANRLLLLYEGQRV